MSRWDVTLTDTFGGEANFAWARRFIVHPKRDDATTVMRAARKAAGLTGMRGLTVDYGDEITFEPRGQCVILIAVPGADA